MGCRTGFYFLVKDLDNQTALDLIKETLKKCIDHHGDIPGNTAIECGNYLEHDVEGANKALKKYFEVIKDYKVEQLDYNYCK